MKIVFWGAVALIIYTLIGYPAVVALKALLRPRYVRKVKGYKPNVTVVVPAHNEEGGIGGRIDNLLECKYPKENLEIIVVSDGSTDRTTQIVREYEHQGVKLIELKEQVGKTDAQNIAVEHAKGEIIVFTDATTKFDEDAIEEMVANFADEEVGCVTGRIVFGEYKGTATEKGMKVYGEYQNIIRRLQSRAGTLLAVAGCVFSFRKSLFEPVREGLVNDLVIPLMVVGKGKRVVFEEKAIAYVERGTYAGHEFARRVRIVLQGIRALWHYRHLLNPFRCKYAFQLISYRVMRWIMPYALLAAFVTNVFLLDEGSIYRVLFAFQTIFYVLACVGAVIEKTGHTLGRFFALPFTFCLMNVAGVCALFRLMKGEKGVKWSTRR